MLALSEMTSIQFMIVKKIPSIMEMNQVFDSGFQHAGGKNWINSSSLQHIAIGSGSRCLYWKISKI